MKSNKEDDIQNKKEVGYNLDQYIDHFQETGKYVLKYEYKVFYLPPKYYMYIFRSKIRLSEINIQFLANEKYK